MGLLKKVVLGLIVVVLVGVALYEIAMPPIKFEAKSIEIVDRDGYPTVKIVFETSKYPVSFYLLTSEGEKISESTVDKPEKVTYLPLKSLKPFTNIVKEVSYVMKAYYSNTEIWSKKITIKGVKPEVKLVNINTSNGPLHLSINRATFKVKNLGDAPLYLTADSIEVYLDDRRVAAGALEVVLPGEEKTVDFDITCLINYKDVTEKEHTLQIYLLGTRTNYTIPSVKVTLNIGKLMISGLGEFKYLDNMTVTVTNEWVFPFSVNWISIEVVDNQGFSTLEPVIWIPETKNVIKPGETVTYTLKFPYPPAVKWVSKVEFYLGGTKIATLEVTPPS